MPQIPLDFLFDVKKVNSFIQRFFGSLGQPPRPSLKTAQLRIPADWARNPPAFSGLGFRAWGLEL